MTPRRSPRHPAVCAPPEDTESPGLGYQKPTGSRDDLQLLASPMALGTLLKSSPVAAAARVYLGQAGLPSTVSPCTHSLCSAFLFALCSPALRLAIQQGPGPRSCLHSQEKATSGCVLGLCYPPARAVAIRLAGLWQERGSSLAWDRVCLAEAQADTPWEPGWHCHGNRDNNGSCQAESRKGKDLQQCRGHTRLCQCNTGIQAQDPVTSHVRAL